MKIEFEIPEYNSEEGMDVFIEKDASIMVKCEDNCVEILANSGALLSLGKQFLYMAENKLPKGSHIHYDGFFINLDKDSKELIISKKE